MIAKCTKYPSRPVEVSGETTDALSLQVEEMIGAVVRHGLELQGSSPETAHGA